MNAPRTSAAPPAAFSVPGFPRWVGVAGVILAVGAAPVVHADSIIWDNTDTDFNADTSWVGDKAPTSSDEAVFNTVSTTDPKLSASATVIRLQFSTNAASGYDLSAAAGASLTLTATSDGANSAIVNQANSGINTIAVPIILGADGGKTQRFYGEANAYTTISGAISSTNSVTLAIVNNGTWKLTGVNTYSGGTTLGNVAVILGNQSVFGSGTVEADGVATLSTDNVDLTGTKAIANAVTLGGGTVGNGLIFTGSNSIEFTGLLGLDTNSGGLRRVTNNIGGSGALTFSGPVNLSLDKQNSDLEITGSGTTWMTGSVSNGPGATNPPLIKDGSGTLILTGNNSYTATTTVSAGVLNIGSSTALGDTTNGTSVASGAALGLQGGIAVAGETLSLAGTGISNDGALRNISGDNSWSGLITLANSPLSHRIHSDAGLLTISGGIDETGTGNKTLIFGGSGSILVSSAITASPTGNIAVTKEGGGTLTLSATNTYTGATAVNEGTLVVGDGTSGSLSDTAVTVASGATLMGSGTIGSDTTAGASVTIQAGGTHSPGNSAAIQQINGSTTYAADSIFVWELYGNTTSNSPVVFDQVNINGSLKIENGALFDVVLNDTDSSVNLTNSFWQQAQQWQVFTSTGNIDYTNGFTLHSVSSNQTPVSSYGSFSFTYGTGTVTLNWTPVPELSNLLVGVLLGAGVMRRRRK